MGGAWGGAGGKGRRLRLLFGSLFTHVRRVVTCISAYLVSCDCRYCKDVLPFATYIRDPDARRVACSGPRCSRWRAEAGRRPATPGRRPLLIPGARRGASRQPGRPPPSSPHRPWGLQPDRGCHRLSHRIPLVSTGC